MAKLTAPLFSFKASGALAKTLVYGNWKGINTARSYTIPANPDTADQQEQRGYFGEAVSLWHTLGLDSDDVAAWNRYSATLPNPQSGFNAFVGTVIDLRRAGISLANLAMGFNGSIADSGAGQVDFAVTEDGSASAVDFLWGYSPTALLNVAAGVETSNTWNAANVAATSGAIVYMRARIEDGSNVVRGWTGTYRFGPVS